MNYAIVDIGSNAIKYKIFNQNLELVEYYRHPLRPGRDVFSKGYLEEKTIQDLLTLLLKYKEIFKTQAINLVDDLMIVFPNDIFIQKIKPMQLWL